MIGWPPGPAGQAARTARGSMPATIGLTPGTGPRLKSARLPVAEPRDPSEKVDLAARLFLLQGGLAPLEQRDAAAFESEQVGKNCDVDMVISPGGISGQMRGGTKIVQRLVDQVETLQLAQLCSGELPGLGQKGAQIVLHLCRPPRQPVERVCQPGQQSRNRQVCSAAAIRVEDMNAHSRPTTASMQA